MKKFQIGERVAVYGPGWDSAGNGRFREPVEGRWLGIITATDHNYLVVRPDQIGAGPLNVYDKQCRRLVKKPRRRCWIYESDFEKKDGTDCFIQFHEPKPLKTKPGEDEDPIIEFVEIRRKKP